MYTSISMSFNESRKSPKKYFEWRKERSKNTVTKIEKFSSLKKAKVLEIGIGYGALSSLLLAKGALVTGTEADIDSLKIARENLKNKRNFRLIEAKGNKLQFKNNSYDIVILFDVIEHVEKPDIMMKECVRVLKKGGLLYCEFTPYYSLIGHHLYDYAKWPIHILPKKLIKKIVLSKKDNTFFSNELSWKQFESLNKLKVSEFQKMVINLKILNQKFILKYPDLFEINLPFLNLLGQFKDILCFSFEGFYRKLG